MDNPSWEVDYRRTVHHTSIHHLSDVVQTLVRPWGAHQRLWEYQETEAEWEQLVTNG